jgi:rod shape-determining protein MreD
MVVLQKTAMPEIFHLGYLPDLVMMFVLAWTIAYGFENSLWLAIGAGFIYDLLSFVPIGTHVLIFVLIIYFVSFFSRRFAVDLRGTGVLLVLFFILASEIGSHMLLILAVGFENSFWKEFIGSLGNFKQFIFETLANSILFFVNYAFLKRNKKNYLQIK